MWNSNALFILAVAGVLVAVANPAAAEGDAERGARAFMQCAACHSMVPGDHRTGPSLAGIWHLKSGTVGGFRRYSKALKELGITWNEETLGEWLKNPKEMIPGNRMVFRGITDSKMRQDLIAFLKNPSRAEKGSARGRDGMGGGMGDGRPLNLKELGANNQIKSITYCADTYDVTTKTGDTHQFWEFNVRFKSDSSENGPTKGNPVLIPAGMRGDRASVVFSSPEEISPLIHRKCD